MKSSSTNDSRNKHAPELNDAFTSRPWAWLAALLSASLVTLAGLHHGNAPEVIAWRAFSAAACLGVLIHLTVWVITTWLPLR